MKKIFILSIIFFFTVSINAQNNNNNNNNNNKKEKEKEKEKKSIQPLPEGYGKIKWGTLLSKAKPDIIGKLEYTDDIKVIISKDGELKYYYGFFFDKSGTEGKLFYVSLSFPYLSMNEVKEKIIAKYSQPASENIRKNQGAIAWDSEKTIIIMWVDRYRDKPYCKRIIYVSKEIAKELNEYNNKFFNSTEIDILKKLNP